MTARVRTAILISGRGSNMAALVEAARKPEFSAEIVLVLSDNEKAAGLDFAGAAGVRAEALAYRRFARKADFEAELDRRLVEARVELICLAGFMRILSRRFVEKWERRVLNIHPSLLPDLKGLNTHERALAEGRSEHGCTVHYVSGEVDAGPIVAQASAPVLPGDDAASLAARILAEEHRLYPRALDAVARALRAGQAHEPVDSWRV